MSRRVIIGICLFVSAACTTAESPSIFKLPMEKTGADGAPMAFVPAGKFLYGDRNEPMSLPAFYMDKYEVTVSRYAHFLQMTGHREPKYWDQVIVLSLGSTGSTRMPTAVNMASGCQLNRSGRKRRVAPMDGNILGGMTSQQVFKRTLVKLISTMRVLIFIVMCSLLWAAMKMAKASTAFTTCQGTSGNGPVPTLTALKRCAVAGHGSTTQVLYDR